MNGYLVLVTCAFNAVPVRLFADKDAAVTFAGSLEPSGDDPYLAWLGRPLRRGESGPLRLNDRPLFVSVVPFEGGKPGEPIPVKIFGRPSEKGD